MEIRYFVDKKLMREAIEKEVLARFWQGVTIKLSRELGTESNYIIDHLESDIRIQFKIREVPSDGKPVVACGANGTEYNSISTGRITQDGFLVCYGNVNGYDSVPYLNWRKFIPDSKLKEKS